MRTVQGDLIQLAKAGEFDVIIHGCNCQCSMGAGIALAIREAFPEAYAADRATPRGDRGKLGTFSVGIVDRYHHELHVVNAYTQYHWEGEGVLVDYAAIRRCMYRLKRRYARPPRLRIGLPKMGAGLARGDWHTIRAILEEELDGTDATVVEFDRTG